MDSLSDFLFVYGTLQPSFDNAFARHLRQQAQCVGEGTFPGILADIGQYPGAVYDPQQTSLVHGTIYDIRHSEEHLLAELDAYEGIGAQFDQPNEYCRTIIPVTLADSIIHCYVYTYNWSLETKHIITAGNYSHYLFCQ